MLLMNVTRRIFWSVRRGSLRSDVRNHLRSFRQGPRTLVANPELAEGTHSSARINRYVHALASATSYLEIGVEHGYTLEAVQLPRRFAVDPRPGFSLRSLPSGLTVDPTTSDRFFDALDDEVRFDIVFIDGLHTYRQTYRDLINTLLHIGPRSVIIIDDVVPSDEISSMADPEAATRERARRRESDVRWHGDVFRVIPILRDHHPELQYRTVVGGDNEQTVLWKPDATVTSVGVDGKTLGEYRHVAYRETFAKGIPEYFRPGSDEQILEEFEASLR